MSTFLVFLLLLLPLTVGSLLVSWFSRRNPLPLPLTMALGFGAGTGVLTHLFVILNYIELPHRLAMVTVLLGCLGVLLAWLMFVNRNDRRPPISFGPRPRPDIINISLGLFILYLLSFIFWNGYSTPIHSWDTLSTMGFKAKIIYYSQFLDYIPRFGKFDYPLHLPTLMAWTAHGSGGWDDTLVKIIFPLYCLAFSVVLFYTLRMLTNGRWAVAGVALLFSSGFFVYHATIAYRDMTMMYFNCNCILLILLWQKSDYRIALSLAALFSGFTTFIKLEGFGYLGMHNMLVLAILTFDRKLTLPEKFRRQLIFSVVSIGIYAVFAVFKKTQILPNVPDWRVVATHFDLNRVSVSLGVESLQRVNVVIQRYLENMFLSGNWNLIWALFAASCLRLERWAQSATLRYLILYLTMYFGIYLAAYSLTQHYYWVADKYDVMSRSLLHIWPLIIAATCILNHQPPSAPDAD